MDSDSKSNETSKDSDKETSKSSENEISGKEAGESPVSEEEAKLDSTDGGDSEGDGEEGSEQPEKEDKPEGKLEEEKTEAKGEEKMEPDPSTEGGTTGSTSTSQYANRLLENVLDVEAKEPPKKSFRLLMVYDLLLAFGLLVAVGGFTVGMMKIYVTHMAKQSINQGNYKAAIGILRKNPVPGFFSKLGNDPGELVNQALYLDAMERLDANGEDEQAIKQLEKITADSRFFNLAQEILEEHAHPSSLKLQGGTTRFAKPVPVKKPLKEQLFGEDEE